MRSNITPASTTMTYKATPVSLSRRVEELLYESGRIAELNKEINAALIQEGDIEDLLKSCSEIMVRLLGIALARVWTCSDGENLKLRAAAGLLLPNDANYSDIRIGKHKVGRIAKKRLPFLTNDLLHDPNFADKKWIERERMIAFAGYPLVVEDNVVGVICAFSRQPLTDLTMQALSSISMAIAGGILRKQTEEARRQLSERLEESRENERRSLSRHLHDEVAQQLAVASIKLSRLEKKIVDKLPEDNAVISEVVVVQELIYKNQRALRQIAHTLHPGVLEHFGLVEALRRFTNGVKELASEKKTNISYEPEPEFPRLDLPVETGMYRIAQEAVTNAIKHARADLVTVRLGTDNDTAYVIVQDNGRGFDPEKGRQNGIGLESMRERAEIIGSNMTIETGRGQGTKITLGVSLHKDKLR
jgi:signal transduction histidine kinase